MKALLIENPKESGIHASFLSKDTGCIVMETSDPDDAVEIALLEKPDLILIDLSLPLMAGWEFIRTIRRIPNIGYIPVIAIAAQCQDEFRDAILASGADDCLQKPVSDQDLLKVISDYKR